MKASSRSMRAGASLLALAASLAGCSAIERTIDRAFSGSADAIDESSAKGAATIRLSAPQVFTREQLINDRMREDGFLTTQLSNAASAPLGSSLSRDLQVITSLAAQLSLSVDPAAKLNFQRANEQADLQQQINVSQLKSQLLVLQARLAQLAAASSADAASATAATSSTVASSPTISSGINTSLSDARISALGQRVDAALKELTEMGSAKRPNGATGTLEDEFEDRLAARSRIRDAINANLLDDSHDADGNSLYRLQITSTVMPGAHKAQYGVVSVAIEQPAMVQEDYDLLYHTWLAAITNRMNQDLTKRTPGSKEPLNYKVLGPLVGLYDVVELSLSGDEGTSAATPWVREPNGGTTLKLAIHPGHKDYFVRVEDQRPSLKAFVDLLDERRIQQRGCLFELLRIKTGGAALRPSPCDSALKQNPSNNLEGPEAALGLADAMLDVVPSVETIVLALGDRSRIPDKVKVSAEKEIDRYAIALESSRRLYRLLRTVCQGSGLSGAACAEFDDEAKVAAATKAPKRFQDALDTWQKKVAVFPYSVDPVTRVQRVSTVASAANAFELAAGLSATAPGSGVSLGAGIDAARRASGRVDAMERVPAVIGFAGHTNLTKELIAAKQQPEYEFGWVFGPQLTLDTSGNKLALRQQARTVPVSADISVPGWWMRANLRVRVAWRGNFADGGPMTDWSTGTDDYVLPVRFRLNRASYDALTVTLTRALTSQGYHQARIDNVRPEVLPICKDAANTKVTLLVYGVDLWRNPKVFLGGISVPQDAISVLPDMTGLAATVDTSTLNKAALRSDDTLVVWTNHGVAEAKLRTQVSRTCEAAGEAAMLNETTRSTTIERVSPSQLSLCDDQATLTLSGNGLRDDARYYRLGSKLASSANFVDRFGDVKTVEVRFDGLSKVNVGLAKVPLAVTGADGLVNVPIDIVKAQCEKQPDPTFKFKADAERIAVTGNTGVLRVMLSLPAGKKPSVSLAAKGGEIIAVNFEAGSQPPKTLGIGLNAGEVQVSSSVDLKKASDLVTLEIKLRNLFAGQSLVLTAKPPKGDTTGDTPLTIPVDKAATQELAKAPS